MGMEHRFSNQNLPNYNSDMPWHVTPPSFISFHIYAMETIQELWEVQRAKCQEYIFLLLLGAKLIFRSLKGDLILYPSRMTSTAFLQLEIPRHRGIWLQDT